MLRLFLVLLFGVSSSHAADPRGDNPDAKPRPAAEQLALFKVPPGFEVQLVADETQIQKPMNINFDAAGRLWVTGSELYPWPAKRDANGEPIAAFQKNWDDAAKQFRTGDKAPQPAEEGRDSVRVLSDFGPDGRAGKVAVFADKLNIPIGIQPLPRKERGQLVREPSPDRDARTSRPRSEGDSAIVFSIPTIWLMTDTDGDGRADKREPLYEGFGFKDTHGMASNFVHWVDGWIYGCHGFSNRSEVRDRAGNVTVFDSGNTYRFRPDGSKIEYWSHGQTNPFGLCFDALGNLYSADSHSKPVMLLLRGGFYEGIGKQHDGLGFAPRITDDDHGSSSIAGIAWIGDDRWPAEFHDNLFNGNPVTRRINRARLEWHGSSPRAVRMPDFLMCDDPWFRPVQVKLGPDGALYIADFYNPIIGHYEVPLTDPRRDTKHGRIWRVVWRGEKESAREAAIEKGSARAPRAVSGALVGNSSASGAAADPSGKSDASRAENESSAGAPKTAREARALPISLPGLTKLNAAALVEKLGDPNIELRRLATNELVERVQARPVHSIEVEEALFPKSIAFPFVVHALPVIDEFKRRDGEMFEFGYDVYAKVFGDDDPRVVSSAIRRFWQLIIPDSSSPESSLLRFVSNDSPHVCRAVAEAAQYDPHPSLLVPLLRALRSTSPNDLELSYALRMGIKHCLLANSEILHDASFAADAEALLSTITLSLPTPQSTGFLVRYMQRGGLESPRAGEFVRHVVWHIQPPERISEIVALVEKLDETTPLAQRLVIADGLSEGARRRGVKLPENAAAWTQRVMIAALDSTDEKLLKRAVDAVRDVTLEAKLEPLSRIVRDAKRDGALRLAALEAVANLERGAGILAGTLNDPSHMILRKRAAELLGQSAGKDAGTTLLAALATAPWELATTIAGALAKTDAGCTALLGAIESGKTSPAVLRHKLVSGALASRPAELRERANVLTKDLPPEDARLDKVIAERGEKFRAGQANHYNGSAVFQKNCVACHRFRNFGTSNIGPNLDGVAARGVQRLIEDILDPNRNVDPHFAQTIVETTDGQTVAGTGLREEGQLLILTDAAGKQLSVETATVKSKTQSKLSLMPPIFETSLSAADLNDLVAWLLSQ